MDEDLLKITCHVTIIGRDGMLDDLKEALSTLSRASRDEPGCEYYEIIQNIANPLKFTLVEKFNNYPAFKAHMLNPVVRDFIDNKQGLLVEKLSNSLHVTFINSLGESKSVDLEKLSFKNDIST